MLLVNKLVKNSIKVKQKPRLTREEQKMRDAALSQPKRVRVPRHAIIREKYNSSVAENYEKAAASSDCKFLNTNDERVAVESEPEIKLTEFIPTKIYLKKEVKTKAMEAVNHTVTTKSPTGKVISKVKICSVASDPGSPDCISL